MRSCALPGLVLVLATSCFAACTSKPGTDSLHESFVNQLRANRFVKDVERTGDDIRFSGPGANGEEAAKWRVHIDGAEVQENTDASRPYKGLIKSSWYSNDQLVRPRARDSNLPVELTSNGLAQECWAFWEKSGGRWSWD